ncbi:hypothetical protein ISCGN_003113 [Ixodes scapularis]
MNKNSEPADQASLLPSPSSSAIQTAESSSTTHKEGLWFAHSVKMGLMTTSQHRTDRPQQKEGRKVVKAELDAYEFHDLTGHLNCDPLSYWGMQQDQWPSLSAVAVRYLASPPTSVYSEKAFSTAGSIVTNLRTQLTPKNVSMLCFIRMNRHLARKDFAIEPSDSDLPKAAQEFIVPEEGEPFLQRAAFTDN